METIKDNAAYIVKRINDLWRERPGKKMLQKMAFLIEKKGVDLNFDYGLHFYGPYSSILDTTTKFLSTDGVIVFDYSGYSHLMSINEEYFKVEPIGLSTEQLKKIDDIIIHYMGRDASELELLTTAIYAYDLLEDKSIESVMGGVRKIKGRKYSDPEIKNSFMEFDYLGRQFFA